MALEVIEEGVWGLEVVQPLPGGFALPLRMVVIRLPEGGLWVHNPVALDDALAAQVEALGAVEHLVAPSKNHNLHVGAAHRRWPDATVWAPAGLRAADERVPAGPDLAEGAPEAWGGVVHDVPVAGAPGIDEHVFVHAPSGSLVVADLFFHILEPPNAMTGALLWCTGTRKKLAQSRVWRFATKDRAAAAGSARAILALSPSRAIPCHGQILDGADTSARLEAVLGWMLRGG